MVIVIKIELKAHFKYKNRSKIYISRVIHRIASWIIILGLQSFTICKGGVRLGCQTPSITEGWLAKGQTLNVWEAIGLVNCYNALSDLRYVNRHENHDVRSNTYGFNKQLVVISLRIRWLCECNYFYRK